ncbi:MAG: hypothetical protein JWQ71_4810 [Pedosphaera sp.]|nr:hypothetical protein [Pedosphaera sp.]
MGSKKVKSSRPAHKGVLVIGIFKLVKGLLLIALALGALSLLGKDVTDEIAKWIGILRGDPHNHYLNMLLQKISGMDDKKLEQISIGTFIYAALFLTEGIGLLFQKRWAEYFTVIVTGSFIPLEIYELIKHFSAMKIIALVVNVAILAYLIVRLRKDK